MTTTACCLKPWCAEFFPDAGRTTVFCLCIRINWCILYNSYSTWGTPSYCGVVTKTAFHQFLVIINVWCSKNLLHLKHIEYSAFVAFLDAGGTNRLCEASCCSAVPSVDLCCFHVVLTWYCHYLLEVTGFASHHYKKALSLYPELTFWESCDLITDIHK